MIQGAAETVDSFWLPYVKTELEKKGFNVWLPQLPENDHDDNEKNSPADVVIPFLLKNGTFDEETVIIAHSAGGPITMGLLEELSTPISKAILVAGFYQKIPSPGANLALKDSLNWDKIRTKTREFIFIHSDNDPWGCGDDQGRFAQSKVDGTLIIKHGEGHMGSESFKQPYREFPLLIKLAEGENWGN